MYIGLTSTKEFLLELESTLEGGVDKLLREPVGVDCNDFFSTSFAPATGSLKIKINRIINVYIK